MAWKQGFWFHEAPPEMSSSPGAGGTVPPSTIETVAPVLLLVAALIGLLYWIDWMRRTGQFENVKRGCSQMAEKIGETIGGAILPLYSAVSLATTVYLTFFDGYVYNAWNWLIVIPINFFLGMIWPIYWGLLRWIF